MNPAMIRPTAIVTLVLLAGTSPAGSVGARAQMPACAGAPTQAELNDCAAQEYKKHDTAMNDTYRQLLTKLKDPKQKALLVDSERAWVAYRDRLCAFQSSGTVGGSIHPLIVNACLDDKTIVNNAELTRQLDCKEGDPSCAH